MKKETENRAGRWGRSGLAVALSLLLGTGSFLGSACVDVFAQTVTAQTLTEGQEEDLAADADTSVGEEGDYAVEGKELTDSEEISDLISDTWDESYFGTAVVDTEEGEVDVDGETESLPDSDGAEKDKKKSRREQEEILEEYMETLPEDGLYNVEETEDGEYEITAPFQTKRLIVETTDIQEDYNAKDIYYNTELGETILQFETEEDTKKAFEELSRQYGEESCYPDEIYHVDEILTDDVTLASSGSYSWGAAFMGMNTLKGQAEGRYGAVTVAILDTGIDKSNFMFRSRNISSKSYNFIDGNKNVTDNHGHGTHVAGIIADSTPSNVRFLILKISNSSGYSSLLTIKTALQYALSHDADVVNMSLGFVAANAMSVTYLDSLINKAYKNGIAICCAAGNNGVDVAFCYPANNNKTLAVGAFGMNGNAASYSNYGSLLDFAAPGTAIVSAAARGMLIGMTGTSMAAPHITAAVTYLKMLQPNLSVSGIYNELKARCMDLGAPGKDAHFGWGCPVLTNLLQTGIYDKTNVVSADKGSVAAPVLKKAENVKGGVKIAWKKVKKADKYIIYRKKGNGAFKKVKTVSKKTKSWTDKSVSQGKKYTYAVKAVRNNKNSDRSNSRVIVYIKQPQKIKTRRKKGQKALIRWAKMAKVSGYQIRYSGNKKMKNAKTLTVSGSAAKRTIKGLKKKNYYCRVRAYRDAGGTRYYSAWSATARIKK